MTRMVIVGDTHLQSTHARNADRLRAFDQVIREGSALDRLGAWVHVGDVFHARSTPEDRNAVSERFQAMADRAPVIVFYGNHESPGDLEIFAKLRATHPIHVVTSPKVLTLALATDDVTASIFALPFPAKAGLVAAGISHIEMGDAARAALDAIFMQAAIELEEARARGELTAMVGHVNVGGSIASTGQPQIGREIELDSALLTRLGPIPKILGHIHKPQQIAGAWYAGSICRMDFGEIEEKRFLVVEFDDNTRDYNVRSYPIDVPPMYHVDGQLTRDGFTYQVIGGAPGEVQPTPESWKGCEVRVRYTFKASDRSVLTDATIHAEFAEASRLHLDPVAIPDREIRAPEVAVAKTLADKLHAWGALNDTEITERLLGKLERLEHGDATVLLTDLAQLLDTLEPHRDPIEELAEVS